MKMTILTLLKPRTAKDRHGKSNGERAGSADILTVKLQAYGGRLMVIALETQPRDGSAMRKSSVDVLVRRKENSTRHKWG